MPERWEYPRKLRAAVSSMLSEAHLAGREDQIPDLLRQALESRR